MTTEITLLPGEPIMINRPDATFSLAKDIPVDSERMLELLDSSNQPLYLIIDVTNVKINFSDLITGMAALTKSNRAVFKHPNIKQIIVVTTSDMLALGAKALKQVQYGGLESQVFPTFDEALAYVRQSIAAG
jgi:hypothetical protein